MTRPGQQTAKPPVSPHANLTACVRIGSNRGGSAIWRVACSCGWQFDAVAPGIRNGLTKCSRCQPSLADRQAMEILMLLPATYDELARRLDVAVPTIKSRVRAMKKNALCHIRKYRRAAGAGAFRPVIAAGGGPDARCTLAPRTNSDHKRKYRQRIARAIERADQGGPEDVRYVRHIALKVADKTVQKSRHQPQSWYSALQL